MKKFQKNLTFSAASALVALVIGNTPAVAVELLVNGNLEIANIPPGWSLSETVTDMPGISTNAAEIEGFANQPNPAAGQLGLWLRGFAGNQNGLTNQKINAVLSQTVPGVANESYTFTGYSKWESNFSGAVDTLDLLSPSGEVSSPTESTFELAFLDASNAVLGSPVTFDLRTPVAMGGQIGDNTWRQHTLMGTAPIGTTNVRVTAAATDMIVNIDPMQSGFYDNFSLKAASAPATEKLANAALNQPDFTPGWTLIKSPAAATTGVFISDNFANNTPGGLTGLWLRPFIVGDAKITQTVPGTAGSNYTFTAQAKWEENYSGFMPSATETFMELAFLDASAVVIGTPVVLDLRDDGQTNDNMFQLRDVSASAPAGTASVRVTAGATGMFNTSGSQSAFFDDLSLMLAAAGLTGDYNNDGTVDAADYVVWRKTDIGGQQGYDDWRANFGAMNPGSGSGLGSAAVPEPTCSMLTAVALLGCAGMRRRWKSKL